MLLVLLALLWEEVHKIRSICSAAKRISPFRHPAPLIFSGSREEVPPEEEVT